MKSLHRIISAAAVLLAASLSAFSQTPGNDKVHVKTYVESFNYETMTGTVAIESFVEKDIVDPDATVKPFDVILVLDISSSMTGKVHIYTARESQGYYHSYFGDHDRYYLYNGKYYKVEAYSAGGKFYLRFTPDGTNYVYLTGTGTSTTKPTGASSNSATIWTGVLYSRGYTDPQMTRVDAMKSAAMGFVDLIKEKSSATVNNKIAIVSYSNTITKECDLIDVQNNASTLKGCLDELTTASGTATGKGMEKAKEIIDGLTTSDLNDREQVVILFSDGDANDATEEKKAINAAYAMKNKGVSVYSVGLAAGMTAHAIEIMDYISSDFPYVQATSDSPLTVSGTTKDSDDYYFETQEGAELGDIFSMIASKLDSPTLKFGTDTEVQCEISSTLQLDLPSGASDIKAYTANCTGVSGGEFSFGTQTELTGLTINVSSNEITTEGFNYTENWCGEENSSVHGKELILKIPFNFTPASLDDNLSVIYESGKTPSLIKGTNQYAQAAAPPAPQFVELIINKSGLRTGESAIFEIDRAPIGSETASVHVNRIVLTGTADDGTTVSHKVYFLNPNATYSVTEHTDWSWTYKPTETPQANGFIKLSKDMTTVPDGETATLNFVNTKYGSSKLPSNAETVGKY